MRQLFGAPKKFLNIIALVILSAIIFISCGESIEKTEALKSADSLATQTVRDMNLIETKFGKISLQMEAPLMESYSLLSEPFEIFPHGIRALGYTPDGQIETEITANKAVHRTKSDQESWEAYGNVVIVNHIKKETITTDTLYWDRARGRFYTHAYVKMVSPQGMIQGYGMESDERATDAWILRPFDSYGVMIRDTVAVL